MKKQPQQEKLPFKRKKPQSDQACTGGQEEERGQKDRGMYCILSDIPDV